MMLYIKLVYEFMKTGLFAIGGGLATLPFLHEISQDIRWFTSQDISNMIAVSESTPGPIGVNMATYAGFTSGVSHGNLALGALGGVTATLGLVTPSVIVVICIAKILEKFKENKYVQDGLYGLRPAVVGLITSAVYGIFKSSLFNNYQYFDFRTWVIFLPLLFVSFKFPKVHPIVIIFIGAIAGILFGGTLQ